MRVEKIIVSIMDTKYELFCTLEQACAWAEPIRIAHPEECLNIYSDLDQPKGRNSFICNTTWNCQMDEYPHNEVYTPMGEKLKAIAIAKFIPFRERKFDLDSYVVNN